MPFAALHARVDLLLVPPPAPLRATAGAEFTLYLNNPTDIPEIAHLPAVFPAACATARGHFRVLLELAHPADRERMVPPMTRQTIVLRLKERIAGNSGFASLRLIEPATNAIMFELAPDSDPSAPPEPPIATRRPLLFPGRHIDLTSDIEAMRRHISGYDPIYFAVGSRDRLNARFQFSFKYRVFESGPPGEPPWKRLARELYLAYTQTSIWDLESFSKPFYDSSYKPTLFVLHPFETGADSPWQFSLQAGGQHESNGKGGSAPSTTPRSGLAAGAGALRHTSDSRSLNTLYFMPRARWSDEADRFVEAALRVNTNFQIDENDDISRFRGYAELTLRAGYDRGFQLSMHLRGNPRAHGSVELNATWPAIETPLLKAVLPPTLGGYAQIQYFNGYGESLLDYDVRRKDQLRFGLMIVR